MSHVISIPRHKSAKKTLGELAIQSKICNQLGMRLSPDSTGTKKVLRKIHSESVVKIKLSIRDEIITILWCKMTRETNSGYEEQGIHTHTPRFLWLPLSGSTAEYLHGWFTLEWLVRSFMVTMELPTMGFGAAE